MGWYSTGLVSVSTKTYMLMRIWYIRRFCIQDEIFENFVKIVIGCHYFKWVGFFSEED